MPKIILLKTEINFYRIPGVSGGLYTKLSTGMMLMSPSTGIILMTPSAGFSFRLSATAQNEATANKTETTSLNILTSTSASYSA